MKKVLSLFVFAALGAMATDFKGTIVDSKCSTNKAMIDTADCAARCIKRGDSAVLVTAEGTVYKLADQKLVVEHAGHKVTITGKLEGETITVEKVTM